MIAEYDCVDCGLHVVLVNANQPPEDHKCASCHVKLPYYTCPKCKMTSHNPSDVANLYCGNCHTWGKELWTGNCFQQAGLNMLVYLDDPRVRLVHAKVADSFTPGRFVDHAWVEVPGELTYDNGTKAPATIVIDLTQPDERAQCLPAEIVYAKMKARNIKRYTFAEMVANARRYGTDGPWPS